MTAFATMTFANTAGGTGAVSATVTGASTAVSLYRQSIDANGIARWYDANSIFDGKMSLTMSVSLPKNGSTVARVKQKLTLPIMSTVDTSVKVADAYVSVEAVLPKKMTAQQRLDLRATIINILASAESLAAFQNLESIY